MNRQQTDRWPLEELARRVWEERSQIVRIGNEKEVPYYMLNIRHPTIRTLYDTWRRNLHAIPFPPSDLERITWELGFLNETALMKIQQHFEAVDEMELNLRERGELNV